MAVFLFNKKIKKYFFKNGLQSNKGFVYLPSVLRNPIGINFNTELKIHDNE